MNMYQHFPGHFFLLPSHDIRLHLQILQSPSGQSPPMATWKAWLVNGANGKNKKR